jgi:hypothetical protein
MHLLTRDLELGKASPAFQIGSTKPMTGISLDLIAIGAIGSIQSYTLFLV